ncbi:MAG TPA: hypothetical protein VIN08_19830 [Ohtaekwangia sp.]|uniref:hypothetical protein n=1 Tax=Ohtaekwangia sp. TaxID=2066019 RepID=UPI002F93CE2D
MKLTTKLHGLLDYIVVIFLLASPTLFDLPPSTSLFTYILGFVHLALTITTDFPPGLIKLIPAKVHGIVELAVSIALVGVAFILEMIDGQVAKYFYLPFAAAVFFIWLITDYKHKA